MKSDAFFYLVLFPVFLLFSCDDAPFDDVDIADIPSYYFENNYLNDRVKVLNDAIAECKDGCESFFWITDIHWESDLNTQKSPLLIKYIAEKTGINKILNGGDSGNSQVICKDAIAQLRNAIGSNRVYSVTGNHEIVDASMYESPFLRVAEELRGHNTDIVYGDDNKSYFYFDEFDNKTRFIGLSTFGLYINNDCQSCYTPLQLEWFKNVALNVQTGWHIIVFTHCLYYVSTPLDVIYSSPSGADEFISLIDNYRGPGIISCVLMGHAHKDRIHIGKACTPYILSACDRYSAYFGDINVARTPGTISEQHFEVVVIDKGKRAIQLFSIGGNARDGYDNDPGKEVDVRVLYY